MKRRLTLWRRRWCAWRDHPQAPWSPIVMNWSEPDRWEGGRLTEGIEIVIRAYRCAKHDKPPK